MDENNQNPAAEPNQKADVIDICKALLDKGLDADKVLAELQQMAQSGEIAEEDLAKAQEYLRQAAHDEREQAERLFGMKFVD